MLGNKSQQKYETLVTKIVIKMHSIFQKEIVSIVRDRRMAILTGLVLVLLAVALYAGYTRFAVLFHERNQLNELMRQDWEGQDEKNVHSASHYGTYLFAPQPVLSFLDFGVQNYVGSSIRVEAHLQRDAEFSAANESSGSIRFGDMSVALLLQVLVPLLLIFMSYSALSSEKENGTLKLLLIQGGSLQKILWQKLAAYYVLALGLLTMTLGISALFLAGNEQSLGPEVWGQFALVFLIYALFYFIVLAGSVCISATAKNSRSALLFLLALWLGLVIVAPKYAANLGDNLYPLPSKKEFSAYIEREVKGGIDGHNPANDRSKRFVASVLKANNVDSVSQLTINIDGLLMQEDENYRAEVTKKYFGKLYRQIENQNRVSHYLSLANPFIAVKELSMGISRTDYLSQVDSEQKAQAYRLYMMGYLNDYLTNHSSAGDWNSKAPKEVFARLKKFKYVPQPLLSRLLQKYGLLMLSLIFWLGLSVVLVRRTAAKIEIV